MRAQQAARLRRKTTRENYLLKRPRGCRSRAAAAGSFRSSCRSRAVVPAGASGPATRELRVVVAICRATSRIAPEFRIERTTAWRRTGERSAPAAMRSRRSRRPGRASGSPVRVCRRAQCRAPTDHSGCPSCGAAPLLALQVIDRALPGIAQDGPASLICAIDRRPGPRAGSRWLSGWFFLGEAPICAWMMRRRPRSRPSTPVVVEAGHGQRSLARSSLLPGSTARGRRRRRTGPAERELSAGAGIAAWCGAGRRVRRGGRRRRVHQGRGGVVASAAAGAGVTAGVAVGVDGPPAVRGGLPRGVPPGAGRRRSQDG